MGFRAFPGRLERPPPCFGPGVDFLVMGGREIYKRGPCRRMADTGDLIALTDAMVCEESSPAPAPAAHPSLAGSAQDKTLQTMVAPHVAPPPESTGAPLALPTPKPSPPVRVPSASPAKRASPGGAEDKRQRKTVILHRAELTDAEESDTDATPVPKSRFAGVHWNRRKHKWRVRIKAHGRDTHVGYFTSEGEAASAYDRCAPATLAPPTPVRIRTLPRPNPPCASRTLRRVLVLCPR